MKKLIILNIVTAIGLFCVLPSAAKAGNGKCSIAIRDENGLIIGIPVIALPMDTLPAATKPVETTAGNPVTAAKPIVEKPVATVIKAVPKARKVSVPRQVTVKVKPVKVVKPKIVKPVLKVL